MEVVADKLNDCVLGTALVIRRSTSLARSRHRTILWPRARLLSTASRQAAISLFRDLKAGRRSSPPRRTGTPESPQATPAA